MHRTLNTFSMEGNYIKFLVKYVIRIVAIYYVENAKDVISFACIITILTFLGNLS